MAPTACAYCSVVSTPGNPLKICSRCKHVYYCNQNCQKADYKVHKANCRLTHGAHIAKTNECDLGDNLEHLEFERSAGGPNITIESGSYVKKVYAPTPEIPEGHVRVVPYIMLKKFDLKAWDEAAKLTGHKREVALDSMADRYIASTESWEMAVNEESMAAKMGHGSFLRKK